MLTEAQIDHYRTFGFVTLRGFLAADELASISSEFEHCVAEAYEGHPFDGSNRHWVPLLTDKAPTFCSLAEQRFAETAVRLLGEEVVLLMADGNRYVGDTQWHADMEVHLQGVKIAAYLDSVTADSGALRVIPGSHLDPLHSAVESYMKQHIRTREKPPIRGLPATALASEPGDVVVFNPPLWHASVGGGSDRRMCTWGYISFPREAGGSDHISKFTTELVRMTERMWPERRYPFYDEAWIANARGNPDRMRMVERMHEAGMFAAAGVATESRQTLFTR